MMFQHTASDLSDVVARTLALAKAKGAQAAEAAVSESVGLSVQVRLGETDQIEHRQDKSLDLTVYLGQSKGRASTADFSEQALSGTVQAALDIARYTAQDPYAGLADADLMATDTPDLDKYHEWDVGSAQALELATNCEAAALDFDARIGNSEGANVQSSHSQFAYGNSHGFLRHQQVSHHSIFCSVLAEDAGGMERDYWFDMSCDAAELQAAAAIGRTAAERTVARLGARSVPTGSYPVLFDHTVAGSLIGHLVGALSGSALYRHSSFLCDSIGSRIFPDFVNLREEPHLPRRFGSTYFDSEGVATAPRFVIEEGSVRGYFLGSYSARKLGMQTTANAGGAHNLVLGATCAGREDLLRQMGSGLLLTELMGQGVNTLTGDYSRGAAGFWVENGVIAYPVSGITVAGRLQEMFAAIEGIADDALPRAGNRVGSILVGKMTVAGS